MNRIILFALIFITIESAKAQKLYFPVRHVKDSSGISYSMSQLAKSLVSKYRDKNLDDSLDNMFRFQLVARQYQATINTLIQLRHFFYSQDSIFGNSIGSQYECYAKTMLEQPKHGVDFKNIYSENLQRMFRGFDSRGMATATSYFDTDMEEKKSAFMKAFEFSVSNEDSIGIEEAKQLCRYYNSYLVYSKICPIGRGIIQEYNANVFIIQDSIQIPMRDGAKLTAVVVRDKKLKDLKLPCILVYSIYPSSSDYAKAKNAALKSYVGISVNTRGKRLSKDSLVPFKYDASDAYDIIDWISKQTWCDGRVGMYGGSYLGFGQWAAAKSMHPALKTIVPQVPMKPGFSYPYLGQIMGPGILASIHGWVDNKAADANYFEDTDYWNKNYKKWYLSGRPLNEFDKISGKPNAIFQEFLKHPYNDAYWKKTIPNDKDFLRINMPVLSITGYFDGNLLSTFDYFNEHYRNNKNASHYLLVGPYTHFGAQDIPSSQLDNFFIDSVAKININQIVFDWFDFVFRGREKPLILKEKLNYQVIGDNSWKHVSNLKDASNDTLTLYFDHSLDNTTNVLSESKPLSLNYISNIIDLKDRSDTTETDYSQIIDTAIDLKNKILFKSKPFTNTFIISGEFMSKLKTSINKQDFDFCISIYEQNSEGKYFELFYSYKRASFAKNKLKRQLLKPYRIEELPIDKGTFMAKKISAGSRIVVTIGGYKSMTSQINYGTGKDVSTESIKDAGEPLQIKWYNDSYIKIPVWRDSLTGSGLRNQK
jgi:uncharacterized protein